MSQNKTTGLPRFNCTTESGMGLRYSFVDMRDGTKEQGGAGDDRDVQRRFKEFCARRRKELP